MMSEEDKKLAEEARGCNDCLEWHHHCHAECCRLIFLPHARPDDLKAPGTYITFRGPFSPSMAYYYKLHEIEYAHGLLRVRKDRCRIIGMSVVYIQDCSQLDGNLCRGHLHLKPMLCKDLTAETATHPQNFGFRLTENCLFRYKLMEVEGNVKKQAGEVPAATG